MEEDRSARRQSGAEADTPRIRVGPIEIVEKIWSNSGGDRLEDILNWPDSRVVAIYKAITKREAIESIERQRSEMVAATFSNPTWDDEKNNREEFIKQINRHFNEAIEFIVNDGKDPGPEIDWNNPFYAASKRGLAKTRARLEVAIEGREIGKQIPSMSQEQIRARDNSRKAIDQL